MDTFGRTGQQRARASRLVWLRFPLLAALLVNVLLVVRVPLAQLTQGRETRPTVAQTGTSDSAPAAPRPNDSAPTATSDPAAPLEVPTAVPAPAAIALKPAPSSDLAHADSSPALATLTADPPRPDKTVDMAPVVKEVMSCVGACLAQSTTVRHQRTGELAAQLALSLGELGADEPVETNPPALAVAPPAVAPPPIIETPPTIDPPPTIDNPPSAAAPQPTTLAQSGQSDESPADRNPAPAVNPPPALSPPRAAPPVPVQIVLMNSARSPNVFHFVLDGQVISLTPGEQRRIESRGRHVVRFHRGAQFGYAEHVLQNGQYEFRVGPRGWELTQRDGGTR